MDEQKNGSRGEWKWGMFYFNTKDSRIILPKADGLGWTLNFGHKVSLFITGLFFAILLGIVICNSCLF